MVKDANARPCLEQGNVVPPSSVIDPFGADTMRLAILFIAPPEKDFDWDEEAVAGANRFIKRAWRIVWQLANAGDASARLIPGSLDAAAKKLYRERHRTLAKCTEDFDRQQFNTAISAIMELVNAASAYLNATDAAPEARDAALCWLVATDIVSSLAPICPFWADELWHAALGHAESVYTRLADRSFRGADRYGRDCRSGAWQAAQPRGDFRDGHARRDACCRRGGCRQVD